MENQPNEIIINTIDRNKADYYVDRLNKLQNLASLAVSGSSIKTEEIISSKSEMIILRQFINHFRQRIFKLKDFSDGCLYLTIPKQA